MGYRLRSYKDLGKRVGGWLDSWKDEGRLACVLHREPPWIRSRHSFRRVEVVEGERGIKRTIRWLPFTCWEKDDYHKARHFDESPPKATHCPACRLIEHLEGRTDLADDEAIFSFKAGRDVRDLLKIDLIGQGNGKMSWQDNLEAKTEYVIALIALKDPTKVVLTNERWSLGQSLLDRIKTDVDELGEEVGNPELAPSVYMFEYSKNQRDYSVSRFKEGQERAERDGTWDKIVELWEGPAPDAEPYCKPGDPEELFEAMESGSCVDLPLDEIFAPAFELWESKEDTSFEPPRKQKQTTTSAKSSTKSSTKSAAKTAAKEETSKEDKPKRAVRAAEPPPKKKVTIFACEACGADWPEDESECPGCGLVADDGGSDVPFDDNASKSNSRDFKF